MNILKHKFSTGIKDLDILLEGGYPNPGVVLIFGQTGYEKNCLAYKFAKPNDKEVIYLCLDLSPKEVIDKAGEIGEDLEDVHFIDIYSKISNLEIKRKQDIIIDSPSSLNDISLAINDLLSKYKNKKLKVIFHSVSTFSLYNKEEQLIKFLQVVVSRLKDAGATCLLLVDEGMHTTKFVSAVSTLSDIILRIENEEIGKVLKVDNIPMFLPIKPGPFGIVVG